MPSTNAKLVFFLIKALPLGILALIGVGCNSSSISTKCPGASLCPAQVVVTVSPVAATLAAGGNAQFAAKVENSPNQNVTWEVSGVAGGNPQVGMITATGLYTAPTNLFAPVSQKITAVAVADSSASDSVTATVLAAHRMEPGPAPHSRNSSTATLERRLHREETITSVWLRCLIQTEILPWLTPPSASACTMRIVRRARWPPCKQTATT